MSMPEGFPEEIRVRRVHFENWDETIEHDGVWSCKPRSIEQVVALCNWAAARPEPWRVRPSGHSHNWSPLVVGPDEDIRHVILCDLRKHLHEIHPVERDDAGIPRVRVELGASMESLLEFLEMSPGGQGHAPGFGFLQTPAPGDLTLGGVLAINGHGSAIPNPLDPLHLSYGSLSHQILEFTAIVGEQRDDGSVLYAAKTFTRDSAGNAAFLVHLGRALLVEVVLQVVDNYNLRCESRMDIDAKKLFCAPPSSGVAPRSFAEFVEKSGRAEAIWFPFTDDPWLKVWTRTPTKPAGACAVDAPYNYAFSDNLPEWVSKIFGFITSNFGFKTPGLTRPIGDITEFILGLGADDLWGPSKNTLLYVRSDTLRVTANGYAVQMPRSDLQRAVFEFAQHFDAKLRTYKKQGLYPINGPVEIRVTGLDTPCAGGPAAASPLLSSLTFDATARERGYDIALWIDVLTLPGTPHSKRFYAELDEWIFENYASYARPLPEWSKGYAYDGDAGPWRNEARLEAIRAAYGPAWKEHVGTLQRADPANLFTNAFLDRLFSPGALSG